MPLDLAALLVEAGTVSARDMERAKRRQRELGGALDTALLELGIVPEQDLTLFLSRAAGLPAAPEPPIACDPRARRVFPAGIAERHRVAPFRLEDRELWLVAAYPVDRDALADIGFMLSLQLVPHVAPEWRVRELLAALYGLPMPERLGRIAAKARVPTGEISPAAAEPTGPPDPGPRSPAWELGRVDPEEPLATALARTVEALDATELLREALDPDPVPEQPPGWTLAQACEALEVARDRDEVLAVALRYARDFLEAAAVFAVTREGISGVDAVGWESARTRTRTIQLPRGELGLLRTVLETGGPYLGPIAREPGNEQLLAQLGRTWPAIALGYPIVLRARAVGVLYADNGEAPVSPRRIGDLLLLLGGLGGALERALRSAKTAHLGAPSREPQDEGGWQLGEPGRAAEIGPAPAPQPDPCQVTEVSDAVAALTRGAGPLEAPPAPTAPGGTAGSGEPHA